MEQIQSKLQRRYEKSFDLVQIVFVIWSYTIYFSPDINFVIIGCFLTSSMAWLGSSIENQITGAKQYLSYLIFLVIYFCHIFSGTCFQYFLFYTRKNTILSMYYGLFSVFHIKNWFNVSNRVFHLPSLDGRAFCQIGLDQWHSGQTVWEGPKSHFEIKWPLRINNELLTYFGVRLVILNNTYCLYHEI